MGVSRTAWRAAWLDRCHFGDVRDVLRRMAADGVQVNTIVTSPPYWGLRSYLPAGHPDKPREIGSEPTFGHFLETIVEVFDLARAVLRPDGTMWVNMGDSYASSAGGYSDTGSRGSTSSPRISAGTMGAVQKDHGRKPPDGLKPKDLIGQPWRLAIALQDAGWYLRQDIIWHKPNPMPESTRDRCTKAHEYLFLLAKAPRYYFDQGAIRTPVSAQTKAQSYDTMDFAARDRYKVPAGWDTGEGAHGAFHRDGRAQPKPPHGTIEARKARAAASHKSQPTDERNGIRAEASGSRRNSFARAAKDAAGTSGQAPQHRPDREDVRYADTANKRSVWTVATEAYPGAHFATFPRKLIEPCILAGAPAGGVVLDIFFGSGTTGQVAQQLGRHFIGIELNEANAPLQADRLRQPGLELVP